MFFLPFLFIYFILFLFFLLLIFFFVQMGLMTIAFQKLGIPPQYLLLFLFMSLLGSVVNIPIARLRGEVVTQEALIRLWGFRYRIPTFSVKETTLAINVGGAIIPVLLCLYLWAGLLFTWKVVLATAVVAFIVNHLARPIQGVGIAVPFFIPPLLAALLGILLAPEVSPRVAYISGTMGVLIGADIINLKKIKKLGAPVASIGGAGTFDAIFLTGIIAVLLA
ncbi:MAG: hypothetical protein DRG50_00280 [Deltaproteobacteria bacterium]|nr:MAG: hypothetical protein DRG50_00280 [Deltaproteobacteria bacterium]